MYFINEMEIPFDRFLRSLYSEKYSKQDWASATTSLLETRLTFEQEKSKWMKELEAERNLHAIAIQDLKNELKKTTSEKNFRIGKLISELYSVKKKVKELTFELEISKKSGTNLDRTMEERLFIQKEVASTLKDVIKSVVSEKNVSVEELINKLKNEEEINRNLERIISELKEEKNEFEIAYKSTKEELENKSKTENEKLGKIIQNLNKEVELKEVKILDLHDRLSQSKKNFDDAVRRFNNETMDLKSNLIAELTKSQNEVLSLKSQNETSVRNALDVLEANLKNDFEDQLSKILNEKDELKACLDFTQQELNVLTEIHDEALREKSILENKCANFEEMSASNNTSLQSQIYLLESDVKMANNSLDSAKKEHEQKISELQSEILAYSTVQNDINSLMLSNDLETGNILSTLSNHFKKYHRINENLHQYETELKSLKNTLEEYEKQNSTESLETVHQKEMEEKDKEISDLRSQLIHRKDSVFVDNISEVASTCSITRTEEQDRLADCEGYFEERYAKLKILAVKLKKKIVEYEVQHKADKDKILATNSNLSKMQNGFDLLEEEIQSKKSHIKMVESDLKKSVEELVLSKEKIFNLQKELKDSNDKNVKLKFELSEGITKFEGLNQEFKFLKNKDDTNMSYISELKKTLESYKVKEDLLEHAQSLNNDLTASQSKVKVLEASIKNKDERIETLENELREQMKVRNQLGTELKILESSFKDETDNSEEIQAKLTESTRVLTCLKAQITNKDIEIVKLREQIDTLTSENELNKSKLLSDSASAAEDYHILTEKSETLSRNLIALEEELSQKTFTLQEKEKSLVDLHKEFTSYKLRAQSVLRQSKSTKEPDNCGCGNSNTNNGADLYLEKSHFERTIQHLNEKIEALRNKLKSSELDKNHLQEDHDRLMQRHSSLLDELADKEIASRNKHDELLNLYSKTQAALDELTTQSKLELEDKIQYYENEIQQVNSNNSVEILKLQKQIDDIENKNIVLQLSLSQLQQQATNFNQPKDRISPLLEREAPEGSVEERNSFSPTSSVSLSVTNESKGGDRSPMPLEQLLESVPENEDNEDKVLKKVIYVRDEEAIKSLEKKIVHLSGLLSDSESENHRMVELIQVLKEEIRTYRRSEDRIKHIEHQEYVKNVLLKFLTMTENDGKHQLLPIVSKLLVLSPEEVKKIEATLEKSDTPSEQSSWPSYFGLLMSSDP